MNQHQVLQRPIITEKSTWESEAKRRYAFEVVMEARKPQIKKAIESLYGVRVEKVATQIRKGATNAAGRIGAAAGSARDRDSHAGSIRSPDQTAASSSSSR